MIGGTGQHRYVNSMWKAPDTRKLLSDGAGREVLARALRLLRRMDFVGLAERFSESMTLLTWWLGLPPLNVTCTANATPQADRATSTQPS